MKKPGISGMRNAKGGIRNANQWLKEITRPHFSEYHRKMAASRHASECTIFKTKSFKTLLLSTIWNYEPKQEASPQ
jgi:hypothetical protein